MDVPLDQPDMDAAMREQAAIEAGMTAPMCSRGLHRCTKGWVCEPCNAERHRERMRPRTITRAQVEEIAGPLFREERLDAALRALKAACVEVVEG